MKNIKTILSTIFIYSAINMMCGQTQLEVDGRITSFDPVVKVNVKYSGIADVIGILSESSPDPNNGNWGIGGRFLGGYRGIEGRSVSNSSSVQGVYGYAPNGIGVYGRTEVDNVADNTVKAGVFGAGDNNIGVYGLSTGNSGVLGKSTTNIGVKATSDQSTGLFAESNSGLQAAYVEHYGVRGIGLKASAHSDGGIGIYAQADSLGMYTAASSSGGIGLHARAVGSGNGTGLIAEGEAYGIKASGLVAGSFDGGVEIKRGGLAVDKSASLNGFLNIRQVSSSDNNYSSDNGLQLHHHSRQRWWVMYMDKNNDDLNFEDTGILRAFIENGTGNFSITSDRRLKTAISGIGDVLNKVMYLKPSKYFYKDATDKAHKSLGFIAQEVEQIFPELVREKKGIKTLVYDDFAIISIKAIQEQQALITQLETEVEELKSQLTEIISFIRSKGE